MQRLSRSPLRHSAFEVLAEYFVARSCSSYVGQCCVAYFARIMSRLGAALQHGKCRSEHQSRSGQRAVEYIIGQRSYHSVTWSINSR